VTAFDGFGGGGSGRRDYGLPEKTTPFPPPLPIYKQDADEEVIHKSQTLQKRPTTRTIEKREPVDLGKEVYFFLKVFPSSLIL
jgi:hypothetical protein